MTILNEILKDIVENPNNIGHDENGSYYYITKGIKQYLPQPSIVTPAEKQAKEFAHKLKEIQSYAHEILYDESINNNRKGKLINNATKEVKNLFIEMISFVFEQLDKTPYLTMHYNHKYEKLIIKGVFSNIFTSLTDNFSIKLDDISSQFYNTGNSILLLDNNTRYEDFINTFENYYKIYNEDSLQPKKQKKSKKL